MVDPVTSDRLLCTHLATLTSRENPDHSGARDLPATRSRREELQMEISEITTSSP